MPEPTSALFGIFRAIGLMIGSIRRWLAHRFLLFQPSLEGGKRHTFYPRDFLEKVKLGTTRNKILSMLGEPDHVATDRWTYIYKEVYLQLVFYSDEGSLQTVVIAFRGRTGKDDIKISWLDERLGSLTLAHAMKYCQDGTGVIEGNIGMRFQEITVQERIGPPNAYQYITFGALDPIIGDIAPSEFKWNPNTESIEGNPNDVLINWVAISANSFEKNWFDWSITVPSY